MLPTKETSLRVEKILTYPVKALRPVELDSAEVTKHGFPHDRRFMLLQVKQAKDGSTATLKNMHVADFPQGVLFYPSLDLTNGSVTLDYRPASQPDGPGDRSITFPLRPQTADLETVDIEMHKSPTKAYRMPREYNDWLSACFGFEVILAYLGSNFRPVLMSTTTQPPTQPPASAGWLSTATSYLLGQTPAPPPEPPSITFADCAPYLIASSTSVHDLRPRLAGPDQDEDENEADEQEEGADRDQHHLLLPFRPNLLVSGAPAAWDEDFWAELTLPGPGVRLACEHNCGRCRSINIDYATGAPAAGPRGELLRRLQRDRRVDPGMRYSPIFGRYSFLVGEGSEGKTIRVGDEVVVSRRSQERTVFDWPGLATK